MRIRLFSVQLTAVGPWPQKAYVRREVAAVTKEEAGVRAKATVCEEYERKPRYVTVTSVNLVM